MARTARAKTPARPLPQSIEETDALVAILGDIQRKRALNKLVFDEAQAVAKEEFAAEDAPLAEAERMLTDDIAAWAGVNRDTQTDGGQTKTIKLPSGGLLKWRMTPSKVTITSVPAVIQRLKDLKLTEFLRIKTEIDKEAMLKKPDIASGVQGVKISQKEEFIIEPAGAPEEKPPGTKRDAAEDPAS